MALIKKPFGFGAGAARADMGDVPQTNLLIHSRADTDVTDDGGGVVSEWGNTAGVSWFPRGPTGTSAISTTYSPTVFAAGTVGTLGGAGYIQFDGVNDRLVTQSNNGSNTSHNFFIVMTVDTWESAGQVLNSYGGSATHLLIKGSEGSPTITPECDGAPYPVAAIPSIGAWMLVNCLWMPTSPNAHIQVNDGVQNTAAGSFGGSGWSGHLDLMAAEHNAAQLHGKIAEILAYNGEQTGSDLTDIQNYLNGQYGLY